MDERMGQICPKALTPLPGSVVAVWAACGTPGCRCARGERHGPYFRRVWREGGRTRRAYIRLADVPDVLARCALHREQHPSGRAVRQRLRDLGRFSREAIAALGTPMAEKGGREDG
jgi:hypothetical protein